MCQLITNMKEELLFEKPTMNYYEKIKEFQGQVASFSVQQERR